LLFIKECQFYVILDLEIQTKKGPRKGPQLGVPSQLKPFDQKENLDPVIIQASSYEEVSKIDVSKQSENGSKTSINKPKNFDAAYKELKKDLIKKQFKNGSDLTAVDLLVNPVEFVSSQTTKEQTKREEFFLKPDMTETEKTKAVPKQNKKNIVKEKIDSKPTTRSSVRTSVKTTKPKNEELFVSDDLRECTFTPKTNNNIKSRRTFDEFLDNQQKFQQNVEEKKKRVKK
jgi:hypothetical protein